MLRINYLKHTGSAGYWNQIGKWLYLEIRLKLITASIRNNLRFWGGRLVRNNSAKALNNFTITVVVNVITTWFCIKKCLNFARRAHSAIWDGWNEEKDNGKGHPRTGHEGPEGKKRYSSILYLTSALDRGGWSTPRLGRLTPLPLGKTRYSLYRRLDEPQGRSGLVGNVSPQPRFDPRTVQPVASRYTDWAIPALSRSNQPFVTKIIIKQMVFDIVAACIEFGRFLGCQA